jgi:hypothetical protein
MKIVISGKTTDVDVLDLCSSVEGFVPVPRDIIDKARRVLEKDINLVRNKDDKFGLDIAFSILTNKNVKDPEREFVKGVKHLCGQELMPDMDVKRKEKKAVQKKALGRGSGKLRVICVMPGVQYHKNKDMIKGLAKRLGFESKSNYIEGVGPILILTNDKTQETIRGTFTRKGDTTEKAVLTWFGFRRTDFLDAFTDMCVEFGGELNDSEVRMLSRASLKQETLF